MLNLNRDLISQKLNLNPDKIVINQYKGVYFPITKVACSSVKYALSESMGLGIDKKEIHKSFHFEKTVDQTILDSYYKFAFVRNPFDRILSAYKSKIMDDPNINSHQVVNGVQKMLTILYGDAFYGGMRFKDYLKAVAQIPDEYAEEHFRSQYVALFNEKGEQTVDFIGRFEKLSDDYKIVANKLQFPENELGHFGNSTKNKHYSAYYDDEMVEIVSKRYAVDLEKFGYSYEDNIKTTEEPKIFVEVVFNKDKKVIEFSLKDNYPHFDKGLIYIHIFSNVNEREVEKRTNLNWDQIKMRWKENNGDVKWESDVLDYDSSTISHIVVRQKIPDVAGRLWVKIFKDF